MLEQDEKPQYAGDLITVNSALAYSQNGELAWYIDIPGVKVELQDGKDNYSEDTIIEYLDDAIMSVMYKLDIPEPKPLPESELAVGTRRVTMTHYLNLTTKVIIDLPDNIGKADLEDYITRNASPAAVIREAITAYDYDKVTDTWEVCQDKSKTLNLTEDFPHADFNTALKQYHEKGY